MNNAIYTVADRTDVVKIPETPIEELLQRKEAIDDIIKNRTFKKFVILFVDKWINDARNKLEKEQDAIEIRRLQGEIRLLNKFSSLKSEAEFITGQIAQMKRDIKQNNIE